jgi:hypothetical protein
MQIDIRIPHLHRNALAILAAIGSTALMYLTLAILYEMDITQAFEKLKNLDPPDLAWAVGAIICLRMVDSLTAWFAVKREARIAEAEGRESVKWSSHTFTEKLFIKMGMYCGMLLFASVLYFLGFGNVGIVAALLASAYSETLSLYENTTRAGIKWPKFFELIRKKGDDIIGKWLKK